MLLRETAKIQKQSSFKVPRIILAAFEEVDQKSRFDAYYIAKPLKTKD